LIIVRSPADFKHDLEARLPAYGKLPAVVRLHLQDKNEHKCAAYEADHYEPLDAPEAALKAMPGVYLTTQVRKDSGFVTAKTVFTNPDWPARLGVRRRDRDSLRPQVMALIRDE
jgi:hypothetical protein